MSLAQGQTRRLTVRVQSPISEQQLDTSEQQLDTSEQQLDTSEQQLETSEQQDATPGSVWEYSSMTYDGTFMGK